MTKTMWLAVAVLMLLFAGCGFFIWILQKEEVKQDVQYFLTRHRLQNSVKYDSVAVSVADVVSLNGISLNFHAFPKLKNKIDSFSVNSYQQHGGVPTEFSATAKGVRFSLLELVQQLNLSEETVLAELGGFNPVEGIVDRPLLALMLAGCDQIDATADTEYRYLSDNKTMRLRLDIKDACLGRWDFDVTLTNVSNAQQGQLVLALRYLLQRGEVMRNLKGFLNGTTVTNLKLSYTENGLVKGYKNFVDTLYLRMSGQNSPAELDIKAVQKVVTYLSFTNAHKQRNADLVNTFAAFIKNPEKITFQSRAGKKVPLSVLNGSFVRKITDLLLRLDVSVINEASALK